MEITLKIVADQRLLDALEGIAALAKGERAEGPKVQKIEMPVEPERPAAGPEKPKAAKPNAEPTAPKAEVITTNALIEAMGAKTRSGKREEVKALLSSYNAAKLSELKESDYAAFLEKLEAI